MCGIVGYIGFENAADFMLEGLEKLEYRGYDSAGIAVVGENNVIKVQKKMGRLANLEAVVKADPNQGHIGYSWSSKRYECAPTYKYRWKICRSAQWYH